MKSHLRSVGHGVVCSHLHFDIAEGFGHDRYALVASGWEVGEALYFALYAPDEGARILARTAAALRIGGQPEMADLCTAGTATELAALTRAAVARLDPGRFELIGLSVGALQLGAACYLSRLIRRAAPRSKIVLGGSGLVGSVSAALLERLPSVDVIVDGEGEAALADLGRERAWSPDSLARIPNLLFRGEDGRVERSASAAPLSLERTSPPDFDEYFTACEAVETPPAEPVLPIEASRGCAWEHRRHDGQLRGCTFCGLYRGSPNFREKPMPDVLREIDTAVNRYGALEISFTDAYLPPSYAKALLQGLIDLDKDLTIFCEMRCDIDPEMAALLARAGARQVQLGVEAFSTPILRRMAKGSRAIDNVRALKLCAEYGVPVQYNLISQFPGIGANEVREMLARLPALFGFPAPTVARFYLDRGSRIYANPAAFGLSANDFDRERLPFLPDALADARVCQVVPVSGPGDPAAEEAWEDLETAVGRWTERQSRARRMGLAHGLSYRDTGRELVITDARGEEPCVLRLSGLARQLLRRVDDVAKTRNLLEVVQNDAARLETALAALEAHGLVLREGPLVLGLPIRAKLPNGARRPTPASDTAGSSSLRAAG